MGKVTALCTPKAVQGMCQVLGPETSETGEEPGSSISKLASALATTTAKAEEFLSFLGLTGYTVDCEELCQAMLSSSVTVLHQELPPQLGTACVSEDCSEVVELSQSEILEDDLVSIGAQGAVEDETVRSGPIKPMSHAEEMRKLLRAAMAVLLDTVPGTGETGPGSLLQLEDPKHAAAFSSSIPSKWHSDTKRALLKATTWVKEATKQIDSQPKVIKKWFRLEDGSDRQVERRTREVKSRLVDMLAALQQVYFTKGRECTPKKFAYVQQIGGQGTKKGDRYIINLCDHFMDKQVSQNERVSTLVHEVSHHFHTIDETLPNGDWAYGEENCLQLTSEKAARNADTYLFAVRDLAKSGSSFGSGGTVEELKAKLFDLVGLTEVKDAMRNLLDLVEFGKMREEKGLSSFSGQSLHMRFLGNPGTGKTVVARLVGELLLSMGAITPKDNNTDEGFKFKEASRADLVGEYVGATALKVQAVVQEAMGGVLFIDEAYALVQGSRDSFGVEAVDTLIKEMEDNRAHLIVILAGYTKEMDDFFNSNPGFRSRVPFSFSFEDYTCPELVQIGQLQLKSKSMELKGDDRCEDGSTCWWLRRAAKLSTHCCDHHDRKYCGAKEDDRSNGNGRTMRNLLESSFRHMALRVLKRNEPDELKKFEKALTSAKPGVPECKGAVPQIQLGSGYSGGDLRCEFSLLEGDDVLATITDMINLNVVPCGWAAVTENQTAEFARDRNEWSKLTSAIEEITKHKGDSGLMAACSQLPVSMGGSAAPPPSGLIQLEDFSEEAAENEVELSEDATAALRPPRGYAGMTTEGRCQDSGANRISADVRKGGISKEECADFCDQMRSCNGFQFQPGVCGIISSKMPVRADGRRGYRCYMKKSAATNAHVPLPPQVARPKPAADHYNKVPRRPAPGKPAYDPNMYTPPPTRRQPVVPGAGYHGHRTIRPLATKTDEQKLEEAAVPDGANEKVDKLMDKLNRLVGLTKVKAGMAELRAMVEFDLWRKKLLSDAKSLMGQSFHMQFLGNPGTGKTVVARIVGELLVEMGVIQKEGDDVVFNEVSRADLVAEYKGQTAPKVIGAVEKAIGGVLFVDEAYSLKKEGKDAFGQEAVDTLIKEIEDKRDKVIAIFAGYDKEMETFFEANPGFKSRVPFKFFFEDYKCHELNQISGIFMEDKGFSASDDAKLWLNRTIKFATGCCEAGADDHQGDDESHQSCKSTRDGGNGRTVRNILEAGYRNFAARVVPTLYKDRHVRVVLDRVEQYAKLKQEQKHTYVRKFGAGKLAEERLERDYGIDHACREDKDPQRNWKPHCEKTKGLLKQLVGEDFILVHASRATDALLAPCRNAKMDLNKFSDLAESALQVISESGWESLVDAVAYGDCARSFETLQAVPNPPPAPKYDSLPLMEDSEELKPLLAKLRKLVGLNTVKEAMGKLFGLVKLSSWRTSLGMTSLEGQSFHMRFLGNPGTGKTVVARIVGEMMVKMGVVAMPEEQQKKLEAEAKNRSKEAGHGVPTELVFREASRADLVAQYLGQTAPKVEKAVENALGGVLFIDEAYALVREGKDTFGQEAVDTLIKEMEDKRKNVIVILAGYESEMDTFFDSNPGFKSRVPFSFRFEDYSCNELGQIGNLVLSSQGLAVPPQVGTQFVDLISFASGCCNNVADADCHPSRDNGNGRTVRNVVEALQRAMAKRVVRDGGRSAEELGTLKAADVVAVAEEQAKTRLEGPCGQDGLLYKLAHAANQEAGLRSWFHEYKLSDPRMQLHRMVRETGRLTKTMSSFQSPLLEKLKSTCSAGLAKLVRRMDRKIHVTCDESLPALSSKMSESNQMTVAEFESAMRKVEITSKEAVLLLKLLNVEDTPAPLDALQVKVENCEPRLDELKGSSVMAPLESLVSALNEM